MTLDPIVKGLLDQMAANPLPKLWEIPPPQGREMYRQMSQALEPQGIAIGKIENTAFPGRSGDQIKLRVYSPVAGGGAALPCLVYFHGGGWVIGDLDTHDALCRALSNETSARVIAVDYRLGPEHKFPAAADDAYAAVKWIETNASKLGINANRIAVAGDSAGGNLSAVVTLMAKQKGGPHIVFQLLIYPVTQMRANTDSMNRFAEGYFLEKKTMDWFFDQYTLPTTDPSDWRVSPLAATDVTGLPRAYIVTAGFDPLKDEGKAYADKLNHAGVAAVYIDYPGMVHGFFNMSGVVPTAREAIADAAKALRKAFEDSSPMTINRQIHIVELPKDKLGPEHFKLGQGPMPQPKDGELLLKVKLISLDAANRAWMQGATYRAAIEAGQVMAGGALAEVVEAKAPGFKPGDLVFADTGWQEYATVAARTAQKVERREPLSHLLSVYGVAGLTAYFGLLNVAHPKEGETVVVSAAAGSVGVFVGQIAKIKGCRVVGIAGGEKKCAWLRDELGFDATIDYKAQAVGGALKEAAPKGVDVYFDNVGGDILEAVLFRMNTHGRISCCGAVSQYDGQAPRHGPRGIPGLIVTKRLTMKGFIVMDYYAERDKALADLEGWVKSGKLKVPEDIMQGLENTPKALIGLLAGDNTGKRMVRL